jgi:hypothetical protein
MDKDRGLLEALKELQESYIYVRTKLEYPTLVAPKEVGKGGSNKGVIPNKASVKAYETKENLDIIDATREQLLSNSFYMLRFYRNTSWRYDIAEERYLGSIKLAFIAVNIEVCSPEVLEDLANILLVYCFVVAEYQDIIQLDDINDIYEACKYLVDIGLEGC